MLSAQALGDVLQTPPSFDGTEELRTIQSLGNPRIQISVSFAELPLHQLGVEPYRIFQRRLEAVSAGHRLRALKKFRFSPGTRAERIAKSVSALNQGPSLKLSASEWRNAAEALEFEEEY